MGAGRGPLRPVGTLVAWAGRASAGVGTVLGPKGTLAGSEGMPSRTLPVA